MKATRPLSCGASRSAQSRMPSGMPALHSQGPHGGCTASAVRLLAHGRSLGRTGTCKLGPWACHAHKVLDYTQIPRKPAQRRPPQPTGTSGAAQSSARASACGTDRPPEQPVPPVGHQHCPPAVGRRPHLAPRVRQTGGGAAAHQSLPAGVQAGLHRACVYGRKRDRPTQPLRPGNSSSRLAARRGAKPHPCPFFATRDFMRHWDPASMDEAAPQAQADGALAPAATWLMHPASQHAFPIMPPGGSAHRAVPHPCTPLTHHRRSCASGMGWMSPAAMARCSQVSPSVTASTLVGLPLVALQGGPRWEPTRSSVGY